MYFFIDIYTYYILSAVCSIFSMISTHRYSKQLIYCQSWGARRI